MENDFHQQFINKLEEKYGKWEKGTSNFGKSSFGIIADDLCISKSQFTMLISGKGTEGMYIRSTRNIEQLIKYEKQANELTLLKKKKKTAEVLKVFTIIATVLLVGFLLNKFFYNSADNNHAKIQPLSTHPLSQYFDGDYKADYVSPYLKETEVQSYCPCSAYEGVWELAAEYIIPLPSKKPGLYYIAKSSDVRIKCHKGADESQRGKILIGFENMHNELWIDTKRTPFSPSYFDITSKSYTQAFKDLVIEENTDFIKLADIYTCFYDQFTIESEVINRVGEPCGRYAKNINEEVANKFEVDVKQILENVISSMAQIECKPAINYYCNPNSLKEKESTINYDCLFKIKTENLGIGGGYPYQKNYRLVKQNYSANLLCQCDKE